MGGKGAGLNKEGLAEGSSWVPTSVRERDGSEMFVGGEAACGKDGERVIADGESARVRWSAETLGGGGGGMATAGFGAAPRRARRRSMSLRHIGDARGTGEGGGGARREGRAGKR